MKKRFYTSRVKQWPRIPSDLIILMQVEDNQTGFSLHFTETK